MYFFFHERKKEDEHEPQMISHRGPFGVVADILGREQTLGNERLLVRNRRQKMFRVLKQMWINFKLSDHMIEILGVLALMGRFKPPHVTLVYQKSPDNLVCCFRDGFDGLRSIDDPMRVNLKR